MSNTKIQITTYIDSLKNFSAKSEDNAFIKIYPLSNIITNDNNKGTYGSDEDKILTIDKKLSSLIKHDQQIQNMTGKVFKYRNLEKRDYLSVDNKTQDGKTSYDLVEKHFYCSTPLTIINSLKNIKSTQFPILNKYTDEFTFKQKTFHLDDISIHLIQEVRKDNIINLLEIAIPISKIKKIDFKQLETLLLL